MAEQAVQIAVWKYYTFRDPAQAYEAVLKSYHEAHGSMAEAQEAVRILLTNLWEQGFKVVPLVGDETADQR